MKKRDLYYERIPTKLLREDIRLLGTFLGRVIKDQEGEDFFNIVEKLRLLSKTTLLDKNKKKVYPDEWFSVPIEAIHQAINLLRNNNLMGHRYDESSNQIYKV